MKTVHRLKTQHRYFKDVQSGKKNFEVRKFDRNFKVEDILILLDTTKDFADKDPEIDTPCIVCVITYILPGGKFGIDSNYCVIGFNKL